MKKIKLFSVLTTVFLAFALSVSFTSCNGDKKDDPDPNDGKTDPSTIAATNLIAYFPFEGNGVDEISKMTPSNMGTTTVTFPTGRRGKAFQGTENGLKSGLLYTLSANSKLKNLKAFSVSIWTKAIPNTIETTDAPEQMVFQIDGTGDWIWGNLFLLQHRNWPEGETDQAKNFAEMDCYFWKDDAVKHKGQRGSGWFVNVTTPQWRHIICTYDNTTSEFHAYVNGVHITNFDGTPYEGSKRWQDEEKTIPFGDMKFKDAEHLAIGAWADRIKGTALEADAWASSYKGQLDEFRIYDKALTSTEAKALYDAELTQIN